MRLLILSSLLFLTLLAVGCKHGPQVRVYISDPDKQGMSWYDEKEKTSGVTPYTQTTKFVCFDPVDTQTILIYCGAKPTQ